ncbi:MAG: class I SAM-dependent methyltransferase [Desulfosporosinus sp.]|nr:class I SAM-dependent methyltransferase [Desulfosporosinus sp.]
MEELEKHVRLFNLIAPVYQQFFHGQVQNYRAILQKYEKSLNIPAGGRVLDIGCGTGAFVYCLAERGYQAVGVDFSSSMLRAAKKSTQGKLIKFVQGDVTKGLDFLDGSFDLVLSSYVLHGLSSELRQRIYSEADRLSRGVSLFYDYNQKRRLFTDLIEWAEGGDYFGFIRDGENEMRTYFHDVKIIDVGPQAALYLCSSRKLFKTMT